MAPHFNVQRPINSEGTSLLDGETAIPAGRQRTASNFQTAGNLVKSYIGSGILGLPFAYSQGGVIATSLVLFCIGIISTNVMSLLIQVKRKVNETNPEVVTFAEIADYFYGVWGARLLDTLLMFNQVGVCCVYVVFCFQNTSNLLCQIGLGTVEVQASGQVCIPSVNQKVWVAPWFFIFTALALIRSMRSLSFVSNFANFSILFSLLVILIASSIELNNKISTDTPLQVHLGIPPSTIAVMIVTGIYAFEGIGTVLPCEWSMAQPESFNKVIVAVLSFVTVNYIVFGLIPYLAFGSDISDLITINLYQFALARPGSGWMVMYYIVSLLLIFAIMGSFPLQLFVVSDTGEEWLFRVYPNLARQRFWVTNIFRTCLVMFICILAVSIPNFGLLMAIVGSVGGCTLQWLFPISFVLKLWYHELSNLKRAQYIFYLCLGALSLWMGLFQTLAELFTGDS